MFYFRWQPSALLQNFIHLRQLAAELLLFVQKSKMAAAAILVQFSLVCFRRFEHGVTVTASTAFGGIVK